MSMHYIDELVKRLYDSFHTKNPFEIAHNLKINIIYHSFSKNIYGIFISDNNTRQHIIGLSSSLSKIMRKFVLSHELGHAFLHPNLSRFHIEKHTLFVPDKFEREANLFAAALLIDNDKLYEYLKREESLEWIAYELEVPLELLKLKINNDNKNFCMVNERLY